MKKIILILMLAITTQSYADIRKNHDEFLIKNTDELSYRLDTIKRLDTEIEEADGITFIELNCERRKNVRDYITFLDKTYNSQELIDIAKRNNDFVEVRQSFLEMKEMWQKSIDDYDEDLREKSNINQSIKVYTLDYICKHTGF